MKNTMKKLLCMALAIMLLVSAVPVFAAAADDITVVVKLGDNEVSRKTFTPNSGVSANVGDILTWHVDVPDGAESTTPEKIYSEANKEVGTDDDVPAGDTVYFRFKEKQVPQTHYVYVVVKLDGVAQSAVKKEINDTTTTVGNLIDYKITQDLSAYNFDHAWIDGKGTLDRSGSVDEGDTVYFAFVSKTPVVEDINIVVKVGDSDNVVWTGSKKPSNGVSSKVSDLLTYCWNSDWDDVYSFDHAWSNEQQKNVAKTGSINAGDTVYIMLNKISNSNNNNNSNSGNNNNGSLTDKVSSLKPVILHVYLNNNFNAEDAHYTITSIAEDGTLNLNKDVKEFLQKYYTAKTSDGIGYDGMYVADGYFGVKYLSDEKYEIIGGDRDQYDNTTLDYMRSAGYVHLNVMLTNAKAKTTSSSSSSADTSNPKTGDTIFAPIMVMGLTGTVLAAAYVIGKKRFAR